jgi:hypothetical protein
MVKQGETTDISYTFNQITIDAMDDMKEKHPVVGILQSFKHGRSLLCDGNCPSIMQQTC